MKRVAIYGLGVWFLLGASWAAHSEPMDTLVDIGSHRLHIRCEGQGTPAVVIDVGLGDRAENWRALQQRMARHTRTCIYSRAGYAPSEAGPLPRESGRIADELHALLDAARVPRPCVLVGHSLGGLNMQVYAHKYPADVAGMVLLDPPPLAWILGEGYPVLRELAQKMTADWQRQAEEAARSENAEAQAAAALLRTMASEHREMFGWSAKLAGAIPSFGAIPLVVIASGKPNPHFGPLAEEYQKYWAEQSRSLAGRSSRGRFVFAEHSSHNLYRDVPDLVIEGILSVVNEARGACPQQQAQP